MELTNVKRFQLCAAEAMYNWRYRLIELLRDSRNNILRSMQDRKLYKMNVKQTRLTVA